MNNKVKKEVKKLIKYYNLNCSIETFIYQIKWHKLNVGDIKELTIDDWENISWHQTLSEDFIREFKNKLDWMYLSFHQKLSNKFIAEFRLKLDLKYLLETKKITQDFYDYLRKKVKRYELLDI